MISAKPTENLTGITLEGDFIDFYEIVESIYRMTGLEEDYSDPYWGVKNRLLGICYDIRHAYMGDREVKLVDNGVHDEMLKWHSMIMPRQAVYFSVKLLFPEAAFIAFSVPELYSWSRQYYGKPSKKQAEEGVLKQKYADYIRDQAVLDMLSAAILEALAEVIGDAELEKLMKLNDHRYIDIFFDYATQYVDKCNVEYLKTIPEKRKDKLQNICKRMIQKPEAYRSMKLDLELAAARQRCSYHELYDPRLQYPEEIEW